MADVRADSAGDAAEPSQIAVNTAEEKGTVDENGVVDSGREAPAPGPPLSLNYVVEAYTYTGKVIGSMIIILLVLLVPLWVAPRFLQMGAIYTPQEFKDACSPTMDSEFEDEASATYLHIARRFLINFLLGIFVLVTRAEYLADTDNDFEEDEVKRIRKIRYTWAAVIAGLRLLQQLGDTMNTMKNPDPMAEETAKMVNLCLLISFTSGALGSFGMIRQSAGFNEAHKWFSSRLRQIIGYSGFVFGFIMQIAAGTFAKSILSNPDKKQAYMGQIVLIIVANLMELCMKQLFVRTEADPGLMGVYCWGITNSFKLAIRIFTFVQPDLPSMITAIMLSFGTQVVGQTFNFLKWTFVLKGGPPPHVQRINDPMFLHELSASHACNCIVIIMLLTADVRYWFVTTAVGVNQTYDTGLIVTGYLIAEAFEFLHDFIMFFLVKKSQPLADVVKAARSSRCLKVMLPNCLVTLTLGALVGFEVRTTCLVCGALSPTNECFVPLG